MATNMERLTVTMPAEMASLIKKAVEDGDYASTSEVVREALREWKTRRQVMLNELSALKADIDRGLEDVATGRIKSFDSERIIERGRHLLASRSK